MVAKAAATAAAAAMAVTGEMAMVAEEMVVGAMVAEEMVVGTMVGTMVVGTVAGAAATAVCIRNRASLGTSLWPGCQPP